MVGEVGGDLRRFQFFARFERLPSLLRFRYFVAGYDSYAGGFALHGRPHTLVVSRQCRVLG